MKRIFTICLFIAYLQAANAQDRDKEIQIRVGYGLAVYALDVDYSYKSGGFSFTQVNKDSAVTSQVPIELRYELHPRFNLGIDMRFGKYLYDPNENNTGKSNKFNSVGIGLEGVIVNKSKFRWYAGLVFSTNKLYIEESVTDSNGTYPQSTNWKGGGASIYSGVMWYVADGPLALNFNLARDGRSFDLKEVRRDGSSQDLTNITGRLNVSGLSFCIGAVLRLKQK
jgi:hypothetical protein